MDIGNLSKGTEITVLIISIAILALVNYYCLPLGIAIAVFAWLLIK